MKNAIDFHAAARTLITLAEPGQSMNPAITHIVNAAIAYGDALTARRGNRINQQDHQQLGALLRSVLGNRLPSRQLSNLNAILAEKDAASYGVQAARREKADTLLSRLDEFAAWTRSELAR